MKGNVTHAALIFGLLLLASAVTLVVGMRWAFVSGAERLNVGIREHSGAINASGQHIGPPVARALGELCDRVTGHATAVEALRKPLITIESPVAVRQPVIIQGPRDDGALPVNASLGK